VKNGTTGKPAANIQMILIQLQGGMSPVAQTKTDAEGKYRFDNPQLGQGPMLLRAVYRGVNYHEPATPGKTVVDMQVFDPTDKQGAVSVTAHAIILQPDGSDLDVGEEYNITNKTDPPLAYYKADGSFLFTLPEGAHDNQVSAVSSAGMPVIQSTLDKGKNKQAIAYAFRPGDSGIRMSYKLPYSGNQAKLTFVSPYPADRVGIFVPPTVQVSGPGLSPAGTEQGFSVYMLQSVAANAPFTVSISGTAPPPPQGAVGTDAGQDAAGSATQAPTATATTLPARLDSLKWTVAIGFAAIFALGLIFLFRQPQMASDTMADTAMDSVPSSGPRQKRKPSSEADAEAHLETRLKASGSLDEIKENLFKLELRRQAGTIAEEDYERDHARMQKLLRDLVKG
jgi:lipoprotein-anchoring transpeptidase ErfK/SrfK